MDTIKLPHGQKWRAGDLAAVVWKGKTAYAVVGDEGPEYKIGEASRALLQKFGVLSVDAGHPATTLLFPGSSSKMLGHWPLDPNKIEAAVHDRINAAGGADALRACPGLEVLR